ncbi:DUF2922 domain-containing protein [Ligilactobacillus agilis]|uniref:DUF2922 domain-containing protein n=1 Tax=Ligilactobacillus agilis TaxID=1601 RepID=UPI001437F189|nr:DUF2922 domain-containing protein [Ligilactobacillus agilis]GET18481.1 hypothetical protein PTL465_07990 [Ligilactobacillus agilis]
MKILDLKFLTPNHTVRHLKFENVNTNLDAATLKDCMEQIIALNIFQTTDADGIASPLYGTPVSASYITKDEEIVYSAAQGLVDEPAA